MAQFSICSRILFCPKYPPSSSIRCGPRSRSPTTRPAPRSCSRCLAPSPFYILRILTINWLDMDDFLLSVMPPLLFGRLCGQNQTNPAPRIDCALFSPPNKTDWIYGVPPYTVRSLGACWVEDEVPVIYPSCLPTAASSSGSVHTVKFLCFLISFSLNSILVEISPLLFFSLSHKPGFFAGFSSHLFQFKGLSSAYMCFILFLNFHMLQVPRPMVLSEHHNERDPADADGADDHYGGRCEGPHHPQPVALHPRSPQGASISVCAFTSVKL